MVQVAWEARHAARRGLFRALRGPVDGEDVERRVYRSREHGYTIQFLEYYKASYWPRIHHWLGGSGSHFDAVLIELGFHDAALSR